MDFLDPKKRRSRRVRLPFIYLLVGVFIAAATVALVYRSYGYGVDTSTGQVVENGLVFIDSKPGGTRITLNGEDRGEVGARLVLRSGDYELKLTKQGYRDWTKKFNLEGHSIERLVYPFLFPTTLNPKVLDSYDTSPGLLTQSPDRRWLLIQTPNSLNFQQIDTSKLRDPKQQIILPGNLFSSGKTGSILQEVEWSSDNRRFILKHVFDGGQEYVLVDREQPSASINLNQRFGVTPSEVAMRDKKANQIYILNSDRAVRLADTVSISLSPPLLQNVFAIKPYQANLLSYVTADSSRPGTVQVRIWDSGDTYQLSTLAQSEKYLLDIASFDSALYFVAGATASEETLIFKEPLGALKQNAQTPPAAFATLKFKNPQSLAFSANTRFVSVGGGQAVAVFDFEMERAYRFEIDRPLVAELKWMDGHRFIGRSGDNVLVIDYDGFNQQLLSSTALNRGGFFDRDYNRLFVLAKNESGTASLRYSELRSGSDLPEEDR